MNTGTYNIDGSTTNTYWQYGFGIFGQYYIGSMRQIGLVDEPINERGEFLGIYRKTTSDTEQSVSGEDLAKAFDENIHKDSKDLFLSCIDKATVSKSELVSLTQDFNLRKIKQKTTEWDLLMDLLLSDDEPLLEIDEPSTMRMQTLYHLLDFSNKNPQLISDREFTMFAYENYGSIDGVLDKCLTGWYYYQLNEYWQVACTAIFDGCISRLESQKGPGWMPLPELINDCTNLILSTLAEDEKVKLPKILIPRQLNIGYNERELYSLLIRGPEAQKLSYGFLMVLKVFETNQRNLDRLQEYCDHYGLNTSYDGLSFYNALNENKEVPIEEFIKCFLKNNIINRHQLVAYRKMGGGSQSTEKFIIEDGLIRFIGNFGPGFTGPRVGNLINFLKDLHLITEQGSITKEGRVLLNSKGN